MQSNLSPAVTVTHLGDGIVVFQIPASADHSKCHLLPQISDAAAQALRQGPHDAFYFDLFTFGGRLLGKNGVFYVSLLREGLIKHGALALIGETPDSRPRMRTLLQLDGDMVCKMDRTLLHDRDMETIVQGFSAVQNALLREFQAISRAMTLGLLGIVSAQLSFFFLIYKVWQMFS